MHSCITQPQISNFNSQNAAKESEMQQRLLEREEEMRLAIEERELQKMAAVSQKDSKNDQLHKEIEDIKKVRG